MTRALLLVQQSIKSKKTQKLYELNIEKFRKFTGIKDLDSLVKLPKETLQTMVEDFVIDLKSKLNANTIPVTMAAIKSL